MPKTERKKKWLFTALAGMVLVFVGIQIHWVLDESGSIMQGLSILTSVGLVCTLVMLSSAEHDKNSEIRLENNSLKDGASNEPQTLVSESVCNIEVDEYFCDIKEELGQADKLVNDAVNNLVMNFNYISKLTSSHHGMVLAIEKMAAPADNEPVQQLLKRQMKIAEKIEQELSAAVTSLQFGDLVTQLLGHTAHQIDALNMSLHHIDRQNFNKPGGRNLNEVRNEISKAVISVKKNSKSKPVVQQGMRVGEVDLF